MSVRSIGSAVSSPIATNAAAPGFSGSMRSTPLG
jgi:hypothetical protein